MTRAIDELRIEVFNIVDETNKTPCHWILCSITLKAFMIGTNEYLRSFDNVPPMSKSVLGSKKFSFLRRVSLFGLC